MSGLAGLLAGEHAPGVWRWDGQLSPERVGELAALADLRLAHLDGWTLGDTRREVLGAMGEALGFPETFGRNLDALHDSLGDLGRDSVGRILLWDGWGLLGETDARGLRITVELLAERAADTSLAPFSVLLRGEGPELVGVGLLD